MITGISKANPSVLSSVAGIVFESKACLNDAFPECKNIGEIAEALRKSPRPWSVLLTDHPLALFTMHISDTEATLDKFHPLGVGSVQEVIPPLLKDLEQMKIRTLTLNAPEEFADPLTSMGFQSRGSAVRFSGPITQTTFMPILPLTNPDQKGLLPLAELMRESYAKSKEATRFADSSLCEKHLREIMTGSRGAFLAEASFISSTPGTGNVVSAALVTSAAPEEAALAELFTHPLYRARGLATTELQSGMNRLAKSGVSRLSAWVAEDHEVMRRLLSKLGLKQDRTRVQVTRTIQ